MKSALTPSPSPISHPPYPRERGELWQKNIWHGGFIPNSSPLPAGAWAGDGRGAGGEGRFGEGLRK
jgi:hypothetical protein